MEQWRKDARHEPIIVDLEALVPKDHLLRKIEKVMDYGWLYERLDPYYCHDNGRPGTDPVVLIKMVLIQHLSLSKNPCFRLLKAGACRHSGLPRRLGEGALPIYCVIHSFLASGMKTLISTSPSMPGTRPVQVYCHISTRKG